MTTTEAETAKVLELRALGWGINRIARAANLTDNKVEAVLRLHGLHKERRDLTQEDALRIVELRKSGMSVAVIARQMGWSTTKIQRTLADASLNGWEANRQIKAEVQKSFRDQVIELYVAGQSASSIARQLGVRKSKVTGVAKEADIYREPDRMSADQLSTILQLRAEGLGAPAIAERIGRSPAAVREYLEKHGLNVRIIRPVRIEGSIAYVPLTQDKEAIIDAIDAARVGQYNWSAVKPNTHNCYASGTIDGRSVLLHRFITNAHPDLFVDHINHNGLDCRQSNLRQVTASLNAFNARRAQSTGLPKGVYPCKDGFYTMLRSRVCATAEEAAGMRKAHYEGIFGEGRNGFIDTDKIINGQIADPDTGEILE